MKLTVEKKDFLNLLQRGSVYAGKTKILPILDCVKITIKDNVLNVISNDNENIIKAKGQYIECDMQDFAFCVNAKDITNYIKLCTDDMIVIEANDNSCTIKHKKGGNTYPIFAAEDFPTIELGKDTKYIDVDSDIIYKAIYHGRNFVANDDLRPVMNGIYFSFENNKITVCASDGHCLFSNSNDTENGYDDMSFILSAKALMPILNLVSAGGKITIGLNDRNVLFKDNDTTIVVRLIDGKYPNFNAVIPKSTSISVKCNVNDMGNAINRAFVAGNQASGLLKITIDGLNMNISAEDTDFSKKGNEDIVCVSNENITIGVNYEKLKNCLSAIETDDVLFEMNDATKAVLLKDDEDNNKVILLMPMMLN